MNTEPSIWHCTELWVIAGLFFFLMIYALSKGE